MDDKDEGRALFCEKLKTFASHHYVKSSVKADMEEFL
jgi:hypothetical protein